MTGSRKEYHYSDPALEEVKAFLDVREQQIQDRVKEGKTKLQKQIDTNTLLFMLIIGFVIVLLTTWIYIEWTVNKIVYQPFREDKIVTTLCWIVGHIVFVSALLATGYGFGRSFIGDYWSSGGDSGKETLIDELKRKMLEIDKKKGNK